MVRSALQCGAAACPHGRARSIARRLHVACVQACTKALFSLGSRAEHGIRCWEPHALTSIHWLKPKALPREARMLVHDLLQQYTWTAGTDKVC